MQNLWQPVGDRNGVVDLGGIKSLAINQIQTVIHSITAPPLGQKWVSREIGYIVVSQGLGAFGHRKRPVHGCPGAFPKDYLFEICEGFTQYFFFFFLAKLLMSANWYTLIQYNSGITKKEIAQAQEAMSKRRAFKRH